LQAACQDFDEAELWIEQVRLDLRSPIDRAASAARPDAIGEVLRLVDAIAEDDEQLRAWFAAQVGDGPKLPAALADADPSLLDVDAIRALLADAEATVLARLSGAAQDGSDG